MKKIDSMKYRIRVVILKNGTQEFIPERKRLLSWSSSGFYGETSYHGGYPNRQLAIDKINIDLNHMKHNKMCAFEPVFML